MNNNRKNIRRFIGMAAVMAMMIPVSNQVWAAWTVTRNLPVNYTSQPAASFQVSITVTPDVLPTDGVFVVEERPPSGWTVSAITNSAGSQTGSWDGTAQVINWYFFDATPQTLSYTILPVTGAAGPQVFSGTMTFTIASGTSQLNFKSNISPGASNTAPTAGAQSVTTPEDTAKAIVLTATDPNTGQTLTYTVVSQPTHGSLTGTAPNLTYTPAVNYSGPDSFTFKANDGIADSNIATISITVSSVNDAPVANAQSVSTAEDTAKAITLTGTDVEGSALTYTNVTNPTNGTLSGTGASRTYTPNANFNGSDSFTFKVNDGTVDSAVATVTLIITAVNDAPVANPQTISTNLNTAKAITLSGSDVEGSALTYTIVTNPLNGTLTGTGASRTYTPNTNFSGTDSISFKVNDGLLDSAVATISITVTNTNTAPTAGAQSVTTAEDTAKAITLTATDPDTAQTLTYSVVANPTNGTLTGTGASRTYTPNANFSGTDSFTFKANDGIVDSNIATISITITAVNDAPVANAQSVSTAEDTAKAITLTGTDVEGSALTYTNVTNPTNGTLSGTGASRTYTPNANFNGSDSFTFKVNDGTVDSAVATVTLIITAVNDAPVANPQTISTNLNTAKAITLSGSDVEGSALTYTIVTNPLNGTLTGTGASRTYTPNTNFSGTDSISFKVNDGLLDSAVATISITVTNTNTAPTAGAQSVTTAEDTAKAITLTATDPDTAQTLTYSVVANPTNGTLTGTGASRTYTPNANFSGTDSFTFKANDGIVDSNIATISITITAVNDAPVANAQSVSTAEDTAKAITLTGTDVEGSALTYTNVTNPTNGTLSGTGASRTYTPNANFNGSDSFTFKVNDGTVDSAVATVSLIITAVNDAPVANAQSLTTTINTAKAITLTGSDVEGSALTYTIVSNPLNGTLTGTGASWTYTPITNFSGSDSLTFKVNDGGLDSAVATVSITVAPDTSPPAVSLSAPASNATVFGSVAISANATDNVGVVGVKFFDGTNLIGGAEDTSAPYGVTWVTGALTDGTHTLKAEARDVAGNINSATINVTVNNGPFHPADTNGNHVIEPAEADAYIACYAKFPENTVGCPATVTYNYLSYAVRGKTLNLGTLGGPYHTDTAQPLPLSWVPN